MHGCKTCFKCGRKKPLDEFYGHQMMHDKHLNKCKTCTKSDAALNYRAKRRRYAGYEQQRFHDPLRKEKVLEYQRTMRKRNPQKHTARYALAQAVKNGRIMRTPCEICGVEPAQAHHHDYSQPLNVQWLCFHHHREIHGQSVLPF